MQETRRGKCRRRKCTKEYGGNTRAEYIPSRKECKRKRSEGTIHIKSGTRSVGSDNFYDIYLIKSKLSPLLPKNTRPKKKKPACVSLLPVGRFL